MSEINIPSYLLTKSVEKDCQFTYKGIVYKPGDTIRMKIFDITDFYRLFYSTENKMMMFHDDMTVKNYNILGYLEHIV